MLTFFAITTIVNLALGYGLAIYLGHDRRDLTDIVLPGPSPVEGAADYPPTSPPVLSTADTTPSPAALAPAPSLPGIPAAQLPGLVSPLQHSGPVVESPAEAADLQPATKETLITTEIDNPVDDIQLQLPDAGQASVDNPTAATATETNPASQPASEEDLLAGIAAFRAQLSEVNPSNESVEDQGVNINSPPATVPG